MYYMPQAKCSLMSWMNEFWIRWRVLILQRGFKSWNSLGRQIWKL